MKKFDEKVEEILSEGKTKTYGIWKFFTPNRPGDDGAMFLPRRRIKSPDDREDIRDIVLSTANNVTWPKKYTSRDIVVYWNHEKHAVAFAWRKRRKENLEWLKKFYKNKGEWVPDEKYN